jgi:hydrogenase nickel incorporation protein HypA/HybF
MHEMSIVEALLEQVRQQMQPYPAARLQSVQLRVGQLRQVVPESLTFCYDAAVRGTPLEGSRLKVEELPAEARCRSCSVTFTVTDKWFVCPRCEATGADLLKGDELQLISLELETAA